MEVSMTSCSWLCIIFGYLSGCGDDTGKSKVQRLKLGSLYFINGEPDS